MCGIAGYLDTSSGVDTMTLIKMTDVIRHRGPDDEGFSFFDLKNNILHASGKDSAKEIELLPVCDIKGKNYFLGFGHRRLSILDLSIAGHQPMERGSTCITFNGEIYNFLELAEELRKDGYTFNGHSDTEIILAAYDKWGINCVEHFNGMWAFAIYDSKKKQLFLSRDRFGVKPLYYYREGNKLIFASEIKQLLEDETVPRIVNDEIMAHHLFYNFKEYSEETFFKNIFQLRGGHNAIIEIDSEEIKSFKIEEYYSIRNIKTDYSVENPAEKIGEELNRAVKWRLRSDVKVGSCLSGGLDSSSIVALACEELKKTNFPVNEFETVTSRFEDSPEIDETYFSKLVVAGSGCKENLVQPNSQIILKDLEKIVWHQDEPFPGMSILVQWSVFGTASKLGCKVLFDGQGGDEGLAGYYPYYASYLYYYFKEHSWAEFLKEYSRCVKSSSLTMLSMLEHVLYFNSPFIREKRLEWTREKYLSKHTMRMRNYEQIKKLMEAKPSLEAQKQDFLYGSLPSILRWEDRNSMAFSMETRLPFLDYKYVEAVLSVDIAKKMENGYTKMPLRNYMSGKMHEDVIWRKNKFGFPAPEKKWFYEMPQEYVLDLLDNARSEKYFCIEKLKKDYLDKVEDVSMLVKFVLVELWMRVFKLEKVD